MLKLSDKKQIKLIYAAFLMYMLIYPAKYNYGALKVAIAPDLGGTATATGLVESFFFFSYGIGQVLSGILAKYMNEKYVITFSLLGSSICNLAMSFATGISVMKYIWLINGIVMSTLWCNTVKTLSKYVSPKNLPKALTYTGFSMPIGTALNYVICALSVKFASWKVSFWISSAIMLLTAVMWFLVMQNVEHSAVKTEEDIKPKEVPKKPKRKFNINIGIIVIIGTIFIAGMACQFVKDGINSWVPTILKDEYNMSDTLSILLTLFIPLLGAFSNILLIKVEEKTKDFLILSALFAGISAIFMLLLVVCYPLNSFIITFLCFILVSSLIINVNGIAINHIPLYYSEKLDSGLLAGVGQGFAYLGSTISGFALGYISDNSGWFTAFLVLAIIIVVTTIICLLAKLYTKRKKINIP